MGNGEQGDALARRSASARRCGDTEIAGWREKNGEFLNSMRHAEGRRMTQAVEHQTSRVMDTDGGYGHVLQQKRGVNLWNG